MNVKTATMALAASLLSACAYLPGAGVVKIPDRAIPDDDIKALAAKYANAVCPTRPDPDDLQCKNLGGKPRPGSWMAVMSACGSGGADEDACKLRRNEIVAEMMLIVDHNYLTYEGNIIAGKAKSEFYTNGFRSALEATATLMTPLSTVQILTGTAALTGTLQDSAQSEFYYEKTVYALITQMRADRKAVVLRLLQGMVFPYSSYPLQFVMRDLLELYSAGTLASAANSLAATAAAKEQINQGKLDKALATQAAANAAAIAQAKQAAQ